MTMARAVHNKLISEHTKKTYPSRLRKKDAKIPPSRNSHKLFMNFPSSGIMNEYNFVDFLYTHI